MPAITTSTTQINGRMFDLTELRVFQVRTISTTFEADDFDWGSRDENGEQYLTFFKEGKLIGRLAIEEVFEILGLNLLQVERDRPQKRIYGPDYLEIPFIYMKT